MSIIPTKMDEKELERFVSKQIIGSPKGIQCSFVQLDEKIALKLYGDEYERDECYRMQKHIFKYGFAPETYGTINLMYCEKPYGYYTEIVDTIQFEEFDKILRKGIIQEIINEIDEIGFYWDDWHWENIGKKDFGGEIGVRYICIDFGMMIGN